MEKRTKLGFKDKISLFISDYKSVFILLLLMVVLAIVSDVFLTGQNLMNVVRQVCAASVLGVGFTLVLSTGAIDLSIASVIALIAVVTAKLSKLEGMPWYAVVAAGLALGAICGLLNALIINAFKLQPFIVTLATMSIFQGACFLISNTTPVAKIPDWYKFVGQGYLGPIPIPIVILVVMLVIGYILLNRTVFGRHVLAMGGNSEAARVCGVNLNRTRIGVFIFNGVCAAITSMIIVGRVASAQINAGEGMELDAIAAAVIGGTSMAGGKGNVIGTFIGCMIVGVINNGLNLLNVNSNWQLIAKGLLILVAIILDAQSASITTKLLKKNV